MYIYLACLTLSIYPYFILTYYNRVREELIVSARDEKES